MQTGLRAHPPPWSPPLRRQRATQGTIEIVYNKYRMRRLLSMGPPNYAIHETYKSGLDR
jgi:hypothetical protein